MAIFLIGNFPAQTSAAPVAVTTGTAIKTLLQFRASATLVARILEWGISFDGSAAATPIKCELVESDAAATVTAHVAAGLAKIDGAALMCGDPTTNLIQVGTTATGYTSTAEPLPTVTRNLDGPQFIAPTNQFIHEFALGREPVVQVAKFALIRVTAAAAVNAYTYMKVEI